MSKSLTVLNKNSELSRLFVEKIEAINVICSEQITLILVEHPQQSDSFQIVACASLEEVQLCNQTDALSRCILLTQTMPSAEIMHSAFALGCIDCWPLNMDDQTLLQRIAFVETKCSQIEKRLGESSTKLIEMQFELEQDQLQGQQIQLGMLPKQNKLIGNFLCSRWLAPSLLLSGDFIDYFPLQEKYLACFLADVAGHGASSALLTVHLKNISWRVQQKYGSPLFNSPGAMLGWINTTLIDQSIEKHVAMFLGIIDKETNTLHYSSGAQFPPAMIVHVNGQVDVLEQSGKPLGLFADAHYHSDSIDFPQGSELLVFSDGVLDCLTSEDLQEKEKQLLQAIAQSDGASSLWGMLRAQFVGVDDMSLMAVKHAL